MNIHLTIKGLGLGGAERHVADCAIELKKRGHDVSVSYFLPHKNALREEIETNGISVTCLGWTGKFGILGATNQLVKHLNKIQPAVVHCHLPITAIMVRIASLFGNFRLVYTEHNLYPRIHPLTRWIHRITSFRDDKKLSCSKQVAESLPWPSKVVRNGIQPFSSRGLGHNSSIKKKLALPENSTIFIAIANLLKKKNHLMMIEAFAQSFKDIDNVHLLLVGQDGTERHNLENFCAKLNVINKVHFFGPHSNAAALLDEADVFCLSSTFEGLPIALLESMTAGLPAIVTNVGGMGEAVIDQKSGYVITPGDRDGMASAMNRLFASKELRSKMGTAAKARAIQQYSMDAMIDQLIECYSNR